MCCCDTPQSRQARQQRLQAKYDRKLKRYGTSTSSCSTKVTVPVNASKAGVAPPAYDTIDSSTGPRDLPPTQIQSGVVTSAPVDVPVLHVKVPKVPIMNDPYQNPSAHLGGPKGTHESCQRGVHDGKRVFGVGGLVGGVLMFPFGLFWTKCDSRLICRHCGLVMVAPQSLSHTDIEKAQLETVQPFHPARTVQPSIAKSLEKSMQSAVVKA